MGQKFETNNNNVNIIKDSLFSLSEKKLEYFFEFNIIETRDITSTNYLGLIVSIDNVKCDQFIIKKGKINIKNKICIKVKAIDIKLKMINSNNFLEIKNCEIIDKQLEIDDSKLKLYKFELPDIVENLYYVKNNKNISIKLKSQEIEYISSYEYKFCDNYRTNISVELPKKLCDTIENDKIYFFNGFNYDSNNNILKPINVSSIEILDKDSDLESITFKDIFTAKNGEIINIKGKIKEVSLEKCSVMIEESYSKNINIINLNRNLFKKINQNDICTFINFKRENGIFQYTNLSDIYSSEETFVDIYIFQSNQRYYNRIKVNNNSIDISNISDKIRVKIDAADKNDIFEQKFIYEKISGEKIEQSYEFSLEINKGKINNFPTFLKKKGGKTYQLYFQTKNPDLLPKYVDIKVDEKNPNDKIKIDIFDDFSCGLRKRMTIINAIDQDFFDKKASDSLIKLNNMKILYILKGNAQKVINEIFEDNTINITNINNNFEQKCELLNQKENNSSIYIFEYNKNNIEKERFLISKEDEKKINRLFEEIYAKGQFIDILTLNNLNLKDDLYSIFLKGKIKEYCVKGFTNYTFLNTKKDYDCIKKILLLFIYFNYYYADKKIEKSINFMKDLFCELKNGDYIEKIQVLLYLFGIINSGNDLDNNFILDVFDRNQAEYNMFKEPSSNAFNLFFEIMDKQTEEHPFYQAILQFNGLIKTDLIRSIDIYSGAIYSLNDIKIELYKQLNRFLFINDLQPNKIDANGEYFIHSKIIVFYPKSFFNIQNYSANKDAYKNINKRLETAFLFLIFHEFCGHFKIHINNNILSPKYYLNNDITLVLSTFIKADSGFIFEHVLTNTIIDLKSIIQEENSVDLLNVKYYTQKNFKELNDKIKQLLNNILYEPESSKDEKKKSKDNSNREKSSLKGLPDDLIKKLEEAEKNIDNYGYRQLYSLFKIPDNMTLEQFEEILKNNFVYKKFKRIATDNKKY